MTRSQPRVVKKKLADFSYEEAVKLPYEQLMKWKEINGHK